MTYLIVFLVDFIGSLLITAEFIYLPVIDTPAYLIGCVAFANGLTYFGTCYVTSRVINRGNAIAVMRRAVLVALAMVWTFSSWSFHWWVHLILTSAWMAIISFFFVALQMVVGQQRQDKRLFRFASLYTACWASGLGAGSAVGGILVQESYRYLVSPISFMGLLITAGVVWHIRSARRHTMSVNTPAQFDPDPRHKPAYVWVAWVSVFCAHAVLSSMRSLHPEYALPLGMNEKQAGFAQALLSGGQAICAILLGLCYRHLYTHRMLWPCIAVAIGGCFMTLQPDFLSHAIGMMLAGAAVAYGTVLSVYYCLSHSHISERSIAINEAVVGMGFCINPFIAGWVVELAGWPTFLWALAGLLVAGGVAQMVITRRFLAHPQSH